MGKESKFIKFIPFVNNLNLKESTARKCLESIQEFKYSNILEFIPIKLHQKAYQNCPLHYGYVT